MTVPVMNSFDVPAYPLPRECPYRPSPGTAQLLEPGPLSRVRLYDGRTTWLVTGPAEARALLADQRVSNRSDFPNYPVMDEKLLHMRATREMAREEEGGFAGALFGVDPPEHTRQRQILVPKFTVRRVAVLRPEIQNIVDEQLDALKEQGPPADLVSAFSAPVPMRAVCAYLGVPYSERAEFEPIVKQLFDPERADVAVEELNGYLGRLVRAKEALARGVTERSEGAPQGAPVTQANPGKGLIDDLIASHVKSGELDHTELIAFAQAILVAGTVTTSSILALGTIALLDNPSQYAKLAADPELVPGAVEEILRYVSLVEQLARVATEDIEIAGEVIKAGDGMLISFAGANLDPSVTTHPEELDVTRPPTHHLAFSHGIHHCLGRNLARLELEIAFRGLVERYPTLRLAMPVAQIPTYVDGDVQRVACLPVTW